MVAEAFGLALAAATWDLDFVLSSPEPLPYGVIPEGSVPCFQVADLVAWRSSLGLKLQQWPSPRLEWRICTVDAYLVPLRHTLGGSLLVGVLDVMPDSAAVGTHDLETEGLVTLGDLGVFGASVAAGSKVK